MSKEYTNQSADIAEQVQDTGTEEQAGDQGGERGEPESQQEKKYTDAEVDRIIARKIAAERKRMSKLFNEEQAENELEIRERNVLRRELMADAKDTLVDQGLPSSLANLMDYSDKDSFDKSFKEVTEIFRTAVAREVKNSLRGNAPRVGTPLGEDTNLREAFAPRAR